MKTHQAIGFLLLAWAMASDAGAITSVSLTTPGSVVALSTFTVSADGADDFGEIQTLTVTRNGQYWDSVTNDFGLYDYSISLSKSDTAPSSPGSVSFYASMDTDSTSVDDSVSVTVTAETTPPSVPNGLGSNSVTMTSFNLTWSASTDNVGVTGYEVKRDSTSLGTTTSTNMDVTGLSMNTAYNLYVRATDAAGNWSDWSSAHAVTTANDTSAPSTPTGLSGGTPGLTSFTLTWSASSDNVGVTAYEVMRDSTSLGTTGSTSMGITGLSPNTTYGMKVRARDAVGNWSGWSAVANITTAADTTAPSVPSGLSGGTPGLTSFTLSWSASSDNIGVTAYEVMRDSSSLGTTGSTSMGVTGLSPNTAYAMKVRARDAAGNWSSWSSVLNVTTAADTSVPSVPSGLGSNSITVASFTLTWSASSDNIGVIAYEVMRDATSLGTTTATGMGITGLSPSTAYAMKVRARDAAGNWSSWSSAANVTTAADTTAPSAPSGLGSSSVTLTSFTLNWSASSDNVGVTAYEVMRDSTSLGTTGSTSMGVTSLSPNTTYGMKVRARDAAGNWSSWSSVFNVTTTADTTAPSAPSGLSATSLKMTSFTLNWSASSDNIGVTAYEVMRDATSLGTTGALSLGITGLSASTTYAMKVRARDAAGNWSGWSGATNVTTKGLNDDDDSDGLTNGEEIELGTNPDAAATAGNLDLNVHRP